MTRRKLPYPSPSVLIVEPDRPFTNRKHLREVLSQCDDYIWWPEPHFDKAGLDFDRRGRERKSEAPEIKNPDRLDAEPADIKNAYAPFVAEMKTLGVAAEVRHVAKPDLALHDRFIIGQKTVVWNVPPSGVVTHGKGGYSYFTRVEERPPFGVDWWAKGKPVEGS